MSHLRLVSTNPEEPRAETTPTEPWKRYGSVLGPGPSEGEEAEEFDDEDFDDDFDDDFEEEDEDFPAEETIPEGDDEVDPFGDEEEPEFDDDE